MKNITVKELGAKIQEIASGLTPDKLYGFAKDLKPSVAFFIYDTFIQNGERKKKNYCTKCGSLFDEKEYYYRNNPCPHCGARGKSMHYTNDTFTDPMDYTRILDVDENGIIYFVIFNPRFSINGTKEKVGDFEWLKRTTEVKSTNIVAIGAFSTELGFRFYYQEKMCNPSSKIFHNLVNYFQNSTILNPDGAEKLLGWVDIQSTVSIINAGLSRKNEEKKRKQHTKKPADPYLTYTCEDVDSNIVCTSGNREALRVVNSRVGNKSVITFACPHCKELSTKEFVGSTTEDVICSNCGNVIWNARDHEHQSRSADSSCDVVIKYELMKDTNDLIIRVFNVNRMLKVNEGYEEKFNEDMRIFVSPKRVLVYVANNAGILVKGHAFDLDKYKHRTPILYQKEQEIIDIIKQSSIKYSGLVDALGYGYYGDRIQVEKFGDFSRDSYLYSWVRNNKIELVIKCGLANATSDLMCNDAFELKDGTDVCQVLGVSKPVLKMAIALDANLNSIYTIKELWEEDNTLTIDTYNRIMDISTRPYYFITLRKEYGISYTKALEYLKSCYDYQCISNQEAIGIWTDYLRMAKDMTYRLDNKNTKYPQSLKKEHDKASFAYRVVIDKKNREAFHESAKRNRKYAYSFDNLIAIIPEEPEEIVEEGTNQKHCVASYVNSVRDGNTIIAFIRKKEDPTTSYYTVEIQNDAIVQVRGYTNRAPREKEVLTFLDKWATARKLTLSYGY